MSRLQTPEASDPFYRVRSELRKVHPPSSRLRYSNEFAKDIRSKSLPDGLSLDEIGDFKLELVRRHNPHARRVCHIKGLNDVPVCVVRDQLNAEWENRFIVSPGSLAPTYSKPRRKFNSDSFRSSSTDLLNTDRASRSSSRVSVPKMSLIPPDKYNNDLNEELDSIQALDILCSILQTNSLQTVQAWIEQATDEERNVVLRALRDMKDRGVLGKADQYPNNRNLSTLVEDKAAISYENSWNQTKSLEEPKEMSREVSPQQVPVEEAPKATPSTKPKNNTPVGTQTPVSVLHKSRPPTRIQMTGLSRPSTMKSVREKFLCYSQMTDRSSPSNRAKDAGFTWTVKHRDNSGSNNDVTSKA